MDVSRLVERAVTYAVSHGMVMTAPESCSIDNDREDWEKTKMSGSTVVHIPFSLFPSPLNREIYRKARELTPVLNRLVYEISRDHQFLLDTLSEVVQVDEFTGRLMGIFKSAVVENGNRQVSPIEFGICRFDYFVTEDQTPLLRQVELNTIAASFGTMSTRATSLHKFTTKLANRNVELPQNHLLSELAAAMAFAHDEFVATRKGKEDQSVRVIMVVQHGERNIFDQEGLSETLMANHAVDCVRMSLEQISELCTVLDDDGHALHVKSGGLGLGVEEFIGSVVYFRAGYSPDDYPEEKCWKARELLEQSSAAKCPSVAYQLVGTKKIQQVLDLDGVVERFLPNVEEADLVRKCFAKQWSMSGESGVEATKLAIANPHGYVLKPQREGGGNNLYEEEMASELKRMSATELNAYILMERIRPAMNESILVRNGLYVKGMSVFELGMFGVYLVKNGAVLRNSTSGHLLRTKLSAVDDGGVAAGVAVVDSPALI
ncbi:hypothetical protein NDN08_007081 [Rhodosorus marinus]|uniref:Glutathione synthetase n=1 Tax=Rhodosorus marinus TaxID=101924 RepID=A0AAV8UIS1_9RHOD|nr:hypothetical protein NDN08_007081 [Rhodosorus marinus]